MLAKPTDALAAAETKKMGMELNFRLAKWVKTVSSRSMTTPDDATGSSTLPAPARVAATLVHISMTIWFGLTVGCRRKLLAMHTSAPASAARSSGSGWRCDQPRQSNPK
jgi:hypothetical protein